MKVGPNYGAENSEHHDEIRSCASLHLRGCGGKTKWGQSWGLVIEVHREVQDARKIGFCDLGVVFVCEFVLIGITPRDGKVIGLCF